MTLKNQGTRILSISLPEYTIDKKPDYMAIGQKIDKIIEENFNNHQLAIRGIGMADHPEYNLDELVEVICKLGTDKYDSKRKGVGHNSFSVYDADLQALPCKVVDSKLISNYIRLPTVIGDMIRAFYESVLLDRGYSIRLDILMIYDLSQLIQAKKVREYKGDVTPVEPRFEPFILKFRNPGLKKDALLGIIKLLRE